MTLVHRAVGAARAFVARVAGRRRVAAGAPDGLPADVLADWCHRTLGARARSVAHQHISGWKTAGAYRVFVRTRTRRATVIFKNDLFSTDVTPGLRGLPVWPGAPEYSVYARDPGELEAFLPTVYWCRQVTPGAHYQYLLEDLRDGYRKPTASTDDLPIVVDALPALHQALAAWHQVDPPEQFLRYDHELVRQLEPYLTENIGRYAAEVETEPVRALVDRWSDVAAQRSSPEFRDDPRTPIHGDFNPSNMHLPHNADGQLKVVDWEWAGLGFPEADSAALLKDAPESVHRAAVQRLVNVDTADTRTDFARRWRRYLWCSIERGVLDIAFLAAQTLHGAAPPSRWLAANEAAARRVLSAVDELR